MQMRILLATDQYPPMVGGAPKVVYNLAFDFAQRGHQVLVLAPSVNAHNESCLENNVCVSRFASFEWPWYQGQRIAYAPLWSKKRLIQRFDPEVLHIHSPLILGQVALHWARCYSRPVIATNHFMPSNISQSLASNKLFNKGIYTYFTSFYNRFTHVTTPTKIALGLLQAYHLSVPTSVISNGVDLRKYTPGLADNHIRQRFQLPEDRPLILHVNRLNEEKRIEVLLNAIPQMQTDAHIALVGSGPLEAALRAQVEELHLQSRVSFLGFVKDRALLDLRRASDVFVISSQAELQSLATMEAMACGLPIVAADAGALPELVHHGRNGFLFQPGKSDELAGYLDTLASDGEMRKRMGAESIQYIAPHDRLAVLDQWEELYSRLSRDSEGVRKCRQQLLPANGFPAPS